MILKDRLFFSILVLLSLLFFVSSNAKAETSQAPQSLSKGRALFNKKCSKCHGIKGVGTDKGPPLVHKIYEPNHHSDLSFHFAVERGVIAHHWYFGDMPKIDGVSSEQVDMIIQYVRNLQRQAGIY